MRFDELRIHIEKDVYGGRCVSFFALRLARRLAFGRGGRGLVALLRVRDFLGARGFRWGSKVVGLLMERRYGCYISHHARIGDRLQLPHPVGVVIGDGVSIGADCTIFQHVTLGGAQLGDVRSDRYPSVEDGVTLFAGAVVLGKIRIGRGATIGANAVVLSDVPNGSTAVGVPARVLTPKDIAKLIFERSL